MSNSYGLMLCHDVDGCHATCGYAAKVPARQWERYSFLKGCSCPSEHCKYQLVLSRVPLVHVYWIPGTGAPEVISEGPAKQPATEVKSSLHSATQMPPSCEVCPVEMCKDAGKNKGSEYCHATLWRHFF